METVQLSKIKKAGINMGAGNWSKKSYTHATSTRASKGESTFSNTRGIHTLLDPKKLNAAGENIRECLITDEHPNALPIAVMFDETGSMGSVPRVLMEKLPNLHSLLQKYVEDPQLLFGAIGDARNGERAPLQVGQFESDNRMDETLRNIYLEGAGGGGNHETYELAAYYLARHTRLDINNKGGKGFAFIIGDERTYRHVTKDIIKDYIGDDVPEDIPSEQIFNELRKKYNAYFIFIKQPYGYDEDDTIRPENSDSIALTWSHVMGQNIIVLDEPEAVCETIAGVLAMYEGDIDTATFASDLGAVNTDIKAIESVTTALSTVKVSNALATTDGELPSGNGATRL